jgi:hypothetical protein
MSCTPEFRNTTRPTGREYPWSDKRSFSETQDTGMLLHVLHNIWRQVPNLKPLRVGIALTGLADQTEHQPDLFDKPRTQDSCTRSMP